VLFSNGGSGRDMTEWALGSAKHEEFRQGVWDPQARLHDMDITGQWASLNFSSITWGFAGTRFSRFKDADAGLACLKAYNDWMIDEWCATDPDRFIPCQLPYLRDPVIAGEEIRRNAERGYKAVSFSENPEPLGFPNVYDTAWDPFFRACEETNTVINLHVGSSGRMMMPTKDSTEEVPVALFPMSGVEALVDWIFARVPLRFPGLTIALSEAGVSWVPMAMERLGRAHRQSIGTGKGWPSDAPTPVELVRRNFAFTSIEDHSGFNQLDVIGDDRVMVEVDYPHFDSTWPDVQKMVRSEMSHLPADRVRKVCYENAARIYRHPLPPAEMIARSEIGLPDTALASA
jgi:predicted TIM-barrel fold metal-dependent hydrolase